MSVFFGEFDELDSAFGELDAGSALGLLSFFASESLPESLFDSEPELEADPAEGFSVIGHVPARSLEPHRRS